MIACSRCGQDNDQGSRFCVACGSPLSKRGSLAPNIGNAPKVSHPPKVGTGDHTPTRPEVGEVALVDSLAFAQTAPPTSQQEVLRKSSAAQAPDGSAPSLTAESPSPSGPAASDPAMERLEIPVEAPAVLAGFLVSYDANPLGQFWAIHQGSNLIGRVGAGADADIEFPHATVSSRHAVIVASALPGRMLLTDQASTNGTFVNDAALQPDQHWPLKDGDTVRFGLFSATVKIVH